MEISIDIIVRFAELVSQTLSNTNTKTIPSILNKIFLVININFRSISICVVVLMTNYYKSVD